MNARGGGGGVTPPTAMDLLRPRSHSIDSEDEQPTSSERIHIDNDLLSYCADEMGRVGVWIGRCPLTAEVNYYEVLITEWGICGSIGIGLVPPGYSLDQQPGWTPGSVAFHVDDGKIYKGRPRGKSTGVCVGVGDKIGCGIRFPKVNDADSDAADQPPELVLAFFTKNGVEIGTCVVVPTLEGLYPCIGLHSIGEEVRLVSYKQLGECDEEHKMHVDEGEDDWGRTHDVRINGQLLEYNGRGGSIRDVGLAQARTALNTTLHYYEAEIIDPGESCYIAIGVARRDYPVHQHPGWRRGSVAYHADDGKVFVGSGIGTEFGPRCHKGDRMGCGILFPEDYVEEEGKCSPALSLVQADELDDMLDPLNELDSSDSDDADNNDWPHNNHPTNNNQGAKVKIFFTRNGKVMGHRATRIPRGGFYPTIGMLSSQEKVRVDLHPLTG